MGTGGYCWCLSRVPHRLWRLLNIHRLCCRKQMVGYCASKRSERYPWRVLIHRRTTGILFKWRGQRRSWRHSVNTRHTTVREQFAKMNMLIQEVLRYMRPNTPHTVLTVESAICHGGHLYTSSTLMDSNYGFFSSFAGSSLLTNTQHTSDTQLFLQRMIAYFHHIYLHENNGELCFILIAIRLISCRGSLGARGSTCPRH